jgi:hypothetical protein
MKPKKIKHILILGEKGLGMTYSAFEIIDKFNEVKEDV